MFSIRRKSQCVVQTVNVHLNWVQNGSKELLFDPSGIKLDWVQTVKAVARRKVKKRKEKVKWGEKRKSSLLAICKCIQHFKSYLLTPFQNVTQLDFLITDLNDVLFRAKTRKINFAKPKVASCRGWHWLFWTNFNSSCQWGLSLYRLNMFKLVFVSESILIRCNGPYHWYNWISYKCLVGIFERNLPIDSIWY